MSTLHCRGSIAGAAIVVALLSSRPAQRKSASTRARPENTEACVQRDHRG